VLVRDDLAVGSDLLGTARLLAAAVQRERADLVLFGQQTSDGGGAVLWSAVAEMLQVPWVSQVTALELTGGGIRVTRQTEVGDDDVEAPLPAAVAVTDAINELRYASLKGKMAAGKKPLEVVGVADLGLEASAVGDAGARTEVLGMTPPPERSGGVRVEDADAAPGAVVDFLVARGLA